MKTVKVKKAELIAVVRLNQEEHKAAFEKAFEGYRQECLAVLEANLKALKEKRNHIVRFLEQPPEDHSDDYAQLLAMLDMSVEDVVELTNQEFAQYVQDDWDWKDRWMTSNSKYYTR